MLGVFNETSNRVQILCILSLQLLCNSTDFRAVRITGMTRFFLYLKHLNTDFVLKAWENPQKSLKPKAPFLQSHTSFFVPP